MPRESRAAQSIQLALTRFISAARETARAQFQPGPSAGTPHELHLCRRCAHQSSRAPSPQAVVFRISEKRGHGAEHAVPPRVFATWPLCGRTSARHAGLASRRRVCWPQAAGLTVLASGASAGSPHRLGPVVPDRSAPTSPRRLCICPGAFKILCLHTVGPVSL